MPRQWPAALLQRLASPASSPALLVKVVRQDGTLLALTSWDRPLLSGGVLHLPDAGVRTTAFAFGLGTGVDNAKATALLDVSAITESDLRARRYRGATFEARVCDAEDPGVSGVLARGYIGQTDTRLTLEGGGEADLELRGLTSLLKAPQGDVTSKECRCRRLGDARCKVDLSGSVRGFPITFPTVCTALSGKSMTVQGGPAISNFYTRGTVRADAGDNIGLTRDIGLSSANSGITVLTLREAFPFAPAGSFAVTLVAGCNRMLRAEEGLDTSYGSTCEQFGNSRNYHGEWHLPGNNAVVERGSGDAAK